ncbi:uncharacterized protein At2g29880 [Andrographis paniculata]|uniref:uncharacterized protein At2g29880 n=1 Tax=Andrographis paniculata TaxID=175694 RepID=UPI0021E8865B|nr:uncharacterized protein At2g29880 [Andrographis paniculata]
MKTSYALLRDLIVRQIGLGWDAETGLIDASEAQKAAWLTAHPGYGHLLSRPFAHFDYCHDMFGPQSTTGAGTQSNNALPRGMDTTEGTETRSAGPSTMRGEHENDDGTGEGDANRTTKQGLPTSSSMQTGGPVRRRRPSSMSTNAELAYHIQSELRSGVQELRAQLIDHRKEHKRTFLED